MATNQENTSPFIVERDRRFKLLSELGLWQEVRESVLTNGKPTSIRTVKDTFKVNRRSHLKDTKLRVWLASGKLLKACDKDEKEYADE